MASESRRPRIVRCVGITALVLVVLALSLYGAAHWFLAVPLAKRLSDAVERETGRQLEVAEVGLTLAIDPIVTISGVRLANADWATSDHLVTADRLAIEVNGPRLFTARVDVKSIEIMNVDLALETDADGDHNWHIDALSRALGDLRRALEDGRLTVDPGTQQATIALRKRVAGQDAQLALRLAYSEEPVGVDLETSFAGAVLTATGALVVEGTEPSKFDLRAKGPELEGLGALFGVTLPALGNFSASGTLTAHGDTFELTDLKAKAGASDLSGTISVSTDTRTRIDVDLSATKLDISPFFAPEASQSDAPQKSEPDPSRRVDTDRTFNVPDDFDLKAKLSIQRIVKDDLTIEAFTAITSLDAGRFELSRLEMKHGEAWLRAKLGVGAGAEPEIDGTLLLQDFDIGRFLREASAIDTIAGELDVGLKLSTKGNTRDSMTAHLAGSGAVVMGKGRIPSRYVDLLATDLAKIVQPWRHGTHETNINCAMVQFDVAAGTMTSRSLLFDTETMTMTGQWKLDLTTDENDGVLKPRPKDPTITMAQDLHVTGKFGHLEVRPTKSAVMKKVAEAAVAGVLLGPAGLIVPFVSLGAGHHHPCVDDLRKTFGESIAKELGKQPG